VKVLLTGVAGFIGAHVVKQLINDSAIEIIGIDNLNDYYEPSLKKARLKALCQSSNFQFHPMDIVNKSAMESLFHQHKFDIVIHLAAQAGVRYSLHNPQAYINANLVGFGNVLEECRKHDVYHLLFASSSSVYGANHSFPFCEEDMAAHPMSLYAATKRSNELMAHSYASLYQLPCTGMRFFTVYGPWGRPDMAPFKFVRRILSNQTIDVYNSGEMVRDFTYIDDAVKAVCALMKIPAKGSACWHRKPSDPSRSYAPYRIYNIGNDRPISLMTFINTIGNLVKKKPEINFLPLQPGDVIKTCASVVNLHKACHIKSMTSINEGLRKFIKWFIEYYEWPKEVLNEKG
jgi:UDP-glucuronate 4-epimerase